MKLKIVLLLLLISLSTISCSEDKADDYCFQSVMSGIDSVSGPTSTSVSVPLNLEVTFGISNGCGDFYGFVESNGFPKEIAARVDYTGCVCTEIYQVVTVPYTFQSSQTGEYVLKFVKSDGSFITKTITVSDN